MLVRGARPTATCCECRPLLNFGVVASGLCRRSTNLHLHDWAERENICQSRGQLWRDSHPASLREPSLTRWAALGLQPWFVFASEEGGRIITPTALIGWCSATRQGRCVSHLQDRWLSSHGYRSFSPLVSSLPGHWPVGATRQSPQGLGSLAGENTRQMRQHLSSRGNPMRLRRRREEKDTAQNQVKG